MNVKLYYIFPPGRPLSPFSGTTVLLTAEKLGYTATEVTPEAKEHVKDKMKPKECH
jgi:hypothetical protein